MRTVFTTEDVAPNQACNYWMDVCRTKIVQGSMEPVDRLRFQGSIKAASLGDLTIVAWQSEPLTTYTAGASDDLLLICPRCCWRLEHSHGHSEIHQRSLLLVDDRERIVCRATEAVDEIAVRIPRRLLEERIPTVGRLFNQPVPAAEGDAGLLRAILVDLVDEVRPSTLSPAAEALAAEHVLDLAAVTLGNLVEHVPRLGGSARFLMLRLRAAIDNQLANFDADRASIAGAVGISERHANRVLAQEGTSIMRLLLTRRLTKCASALGDPRDRRSIEDIGYAHGFRDLSHFSRTFKNYYGVSPREFRYLSRRDMNVP